MPLKSSIDRRVFIGVDPGVSGGLAAIVQGADGSMDIKLLTMKSTDLYGVLTWFLQWEHHTLYAVIEQVTGFMPRNMGKNPNAQPGHHMFRFGEVYGALLMALVAVGASWTRAAPVTWMKEFEMRREKDEGDTAWKSRLRDLALRLFPHVSSLTKSTSDALLLAEYCRRLHISGRLI